MEHGNDMLPIWLTIMLSQQQMNCNYNCYNPYSQLFQSQTQCNQQRLEQLRDSVQANNIFSLQQQQTQNVISSIHPAYYQPEDDKKQDDDIAAYFKPIYAQIDKEYKHSIDTIESNYRAKSRHLRAHEQEVAKKGEEKWTIRRILKRILKML